MRITITMGDDLVERATSAAQRTGRSFNRYVVDAVRYYMAESEGEPSPDGPGLLVFSGTGLRPGVDLDSNRATVEAMDPIT